MSNKYKEALDEFVNYLISYTELFTNPATNEYLSKRLDVIQELVDANIKLEKALDKACKMLESSEFTPEIEEMLYGAYYTKEDYKEIVLEEEEK